MASIKDWASEAASQISAEWGPRPLRIDRIAAIITTFAAPLLELLTPREHYHCDDSWHCCGRCPCQCAIHKMETSGEDEASFCENEEHNESCFPSSHSGEKPRKSGVCDCGADAYNKQLERALKG